jgi:hypothetical protein
MPIRNPPRGAAIPLRHFVLHIDCAADRINGTGEFDQYTVASRLDDAAVMLGYYGLDDLTSMRLQGGQRADLVGAHQSRISHDIGCQDRC